MLELNYEIKTENFRFYLNKNKLNKKYLKKFKEVVIKGLTREEPLEIKIPTSDKGFVEVTLVVSKKEVLLKHNASNIIKNTVNFDTSDLLKFYEIITNSKIPIDIS